MHTNVVLFLKGFRFISLANKRFERTHRRIELRGVERSVEDSISKGVEVEGRGGVENLLVC